MDNNDTDHENDEPMILEKNFDDPNYVGINFRMPKPDHSLSLIISSFLEDYQKFSPPLAKCLAYFSMLSYTGIRGYIPSVEKLNWVERLSVISVKSTDLFCSLCEVNSERGRALIIVFRGTDTRSKKNIKLNLKFRKKKLLHSRLFGNARGHDGFVTAYRSLGFEIVKDINARICQLLFEKKANTVEDEDDMPRICECVLPSYFCNGRSSGDSTDHTNDDKKEKSDVDEQEEDVEDDTCDFETVNYLKTFTNKGKIPFESIILTGHSLGGALAALCSLHLSILFQEVFHIEPKKVSDVDFPERNPLIPSIVLYTFGCPRVGNSSFCRNLQKNLQISYRICNKNDLITKLPPWNWGYAHFGVKVKTDVFFNSRFQVFLKNQKVLVGFDDDYYLDEDSDLEEALNFFDSLPKRSFIDAHRTYLGITTPYGFLKECKYIEFKLSGRSPNVLSKSTFLNSVEKVKNKSVGSVYDYKRKKHQHKHKHKHKHKHENVNRSV
eukprot:TRINITY_DN9354_c0_g1_i1.p1 TRINITY_DN9354_c0_g1~~TRINITY_DN9354_c0_g1_i1.p1  ORF type:complete len:495 (-),score=87.61 TRINITY_DN9354_c0_g1_i1:18-1502(-)